jgi:putative phosphoesterase
MIAILADTHMPKGARRLPARCVELVSAAEAVVHAGDFFALSALEEIRALCPRVHAVHGNVDEPALQRALPLTLEIEVSGKSLAAIHTAARYGAGWRACAAASRMRMQWSLATVTSPSTKRRAAFRSSIQAAQPNAVGHRDHRWGW